MKKHAEALILVQHAAIHLREARSAQELLPSPEEEPINTFNPPFYNLTSEEINTLEEELNAESLQCKKDWFTYNGGAATASVDRQSYKKPLFFDIALNYVELNMERLQERAGKKAAAQPPAIVAPKPQKSAAEILADSDKKSVVSRAKVEEIERPMTPEPTANTSKAGLSSLLGGWWGRK